jgi:hypothetical protein
MMVTGLALCAAGEPIVARRVDWSIKSSGDAIDKAVLTYGRYLEAQGLRESTRLGYEECLKRYLVHCGGDKTPNKQGK